MTSNRTWCRFWSKVNFKGPRQPHMKTRCHEWTAATARGYGVFSEDGVQGGAHRWLWQKYKGRLPRRRDVMHLCDNRLCVRLSHLAEGSRSRNIMDCADKGRHGRSKVTREQEDAMRKLWAKGGIRQVDVGALFGVNQSVVSQIVRGRPRRIGDR